MTPCSYLKARLNRGLSLDLVGPNEARLLFDAGVGFSGSLMAVGFCWMFSSSGHSRGGALLIFALPLLLLFFNWVFGVYSYLRLAKARTKALVLCASVACSALLAWLLFRNTPAILLWSILTTGPVALARLLLSLHSGRHKSLARIAINRRGPVLVIGGAGYIGWHTVNLLLRRGYQVRVLDRLMYGSGPLEAFRDHPRFTLITGDATDIAKLTVAAKDCSALIQLAGLVGDPACAVDAQFTRHANMVATRMARTVAESLGVFRFIFASSCSVYGASEKEAHEDTPPNPISLYAHTKIDSERELLSMVSDDFFVTVLRFATVFGHSQRPRFDLVANLFTAQAMTDGLITVVGPNQWRPFIHVRDVARAIVASLEAEPSLVQSQVFNIGDKRLNMTILQLAEEVQRIVSKNRPVEVSVRENPQDKRNYAVSFEKIASVLQFQAETLLTEGIQEMVDQFAGGGYRHYKEAQYSNVAMTEKALSAFQDPAELSNLYAPLSIDR